MQTINQDAYQDHRAETLDGLEDRYQHWSRCMEAAETLAVDADERDDGADRDFWTDILARCEDRYEEASKAYDIYDHWGDATC